METVQPIKVHDTTTVIVVLNNCENKMTTYEISGTNQWYNELHKRYPYVWDGT